MGTSELSRTESSRMTAKDAAARIAAAPQSSVEDPSLLDGLRRRLRGEFDVDPWGFDEELARLAVTASAVRWSVDVIGGARIPAEGPALLMVHRRIGMSEPSVVAKGVHDVTGRVVRVAGLPDVPLASSLLRRLGAVLDEPDEIGGLLRAGELVMVPLGWQPLHADIAGQLQSTAVQPAIDAGVPVLPVATFGSEVGRRWRIMIGEEILPPKRANKTGSVEFAEAVRAGVQHLLDNPR